MKNSRLFLLFSQLPKKQLSTIQKAAHSSYFTTRPHVTRLFDFLWECRFELKVTPTKEQAFRAIFPDQAYDDHKLRLSMSLLLKLMERCLVFEEWEKNRTHYLTTLGITYRKLGLSKHFLQAIQQAKLSNTNQPYRSDIFYDLELKIALEEYQFKATQKQIQELNLQSILDQLDLAYFIQKLRYACYAHSHQAVFKIEYDYGLILNLLDYLPSSKHLTNPTLAIYYYCFKALKNPASPELFRQFKELLFKNSAVFPDTELRDLYLLAINYCIRQLNQGDRSFAADGFDFYKDGIEKEYLLIDEKLSRFTYNNITALGIRVGEFEWVEHFVYQYKTNLEKKFQESSYSFNLARIKYEQKQFNSAIRLLQHAEYKDVVLNLSAKAILVKIFFELEEFDTLEAHLDAMNTFIRRKKMMSYHRNNFLNLVRFTRKILETPSGNTAARKKLLSELEQTSAIAEKEWLKKQL